MPNWAILWFDLTVGSGVKQSIGYTATAADDANTVATKLKAAIDANPTLAADITVTIDDGGKIIRPKRWTRN